MRLTVAAVLLAATACSGGPVDTITAAPDAVRERGSVRIELVLVQSAGAPDGRSFETTSRTRGVVDLAGERGRMTMELSVPETLRSVGGLSLRPCEIVLDGSTVYLSVPEDQRARSDGRPWVRVDASELAGFDVQGFDAADPTGSLEILRRMSGDVERLGSEVVDGVDTVHYRGRVDAQRLAEDDQFSRLVERLEIESFPMDVWIDDQGLPRRTEATLSARGGRVRVEMSMRLRDFGEAVDVQSPPGDQVHRPADAQAAAGACFGIPEPAGG